MELLGLPNEHLETGKMFGSMLISEDYCHGYLPIITMIWGTPFNLPVKKELYTVLSIEYDLKTIPGILRGEGLFEWLSRPNPFNHKNFLRGETNDLLVAQALAYDQINQLRKQQTHDKPAGTGTRTLDAGLGNEGEAVRCPA